MWRTGVWTILSEARLCPLPERRNDMPLEHVNEILFDGQIFKVGRWRLPAAHPNFSNSGPTRNYVFVFPRTAGWIQHAGGQPFVVDANTVTFYNRGQEYMRRVISPLGDHSDYFATEPGVLRQVIAAWNPAALDGSDRIIPFTHGPSDPQTYWNQRIVYTHVRRSTTPDPLFVEETMLNVLERLVSFVYMQSARGRQRHRDLVEHAREVIAARFNAPLTLSAIAQATDSSVFHLCRAFRARTGLTIHSYRHQLRLRTALERVADPSTDLSALALDLGFCTHSHFTAAFKHLYGVTPSDLRRGASGRRLLLELSSRASSVHRTQ